MIECPHTRAGQQIPAIGADVCVYCIQDDPETFNCKDSNCPLNETVGTPHFHSDQAEKIVKGL